MSVFVRCDIVLNLLRSTRDEFRLHGELVGRRGASPRAPVFSSTPSISNRTLPGLTTATQASRGALPLAHARFGGLLRDRLVREEPDPDLAAALDEAGDRDAARFDLARGDPAVLERLQAEVAERDRCTRSWPCRCRRPRCCFLNFTLPGINMTSSVLSVALAARVVGEADLARLAAVDPHLDADDAVGRPRLGDAVVDLRAERVEAAAVLRGTSRCGRSPRRASRPPTWTLIPFAPNRSADSIALRIARRNATRFSSCIAIASETSCASISGLSISRMLMKTSRCVRFLDVFLEAVHLAALAADDDPGREVRMFTFSLLAARSISIADTPACPRRFFSSFRSFEVLVEELGVLLRRVPARAPRLVEADAKSVRVNLLSHDYLLPAAARGAALTGVTSSAIDTCEDRLRMR